MSSMRMIILTVGVMAAGALSWTSGHLLLNRFFGPRPAPFGLTGEAVFGALVGLAVVLYMERRRRRARKAEQCDDNPFRP